MDFTWLQLVVAFLGSSGLIGGGFTLIKFIYERLDKKKTDKALKEAEQKKAEAEERDRALNRWKELYAEMKLENQKLEAEIEKLKKGDSLAQPTITKIYRALSKLGNEIDIVDTIFIKEFLRFEDNKEIQKLHAAIKKQMEILKNKFDDLQRCLP